MEHTTENNLIQCRFCSWRANESFECNRKERRVINDSDLPTPSWCPLRENPDKHEITKLKMGQDR